jgi:Ca2+-binding EF-hand superfamily protein
LAAITLAAALFPSAASAQASATAPALTRAMLIQKIDTDFKNSDANGDGRITKAEIQAVLDRRAAQAEASLKQRQQDEFQKLDTNRDGQLSLAEYRAGTTVSVRPDAADLRLRQLDTNKDGVVTSAEFRTDMLGEFDRMDANKDGVLSAQEAGAAPRR